MNEDVSGVVIGGVVLIAGSTILRLVKEGKWQGNTGRVMIFGFLLAAALLAVGIVAPTIAKVLTALGVVGAFAVNGPALFDTLQTVGATPQQEIRRM